MKVLSNKFGRVLLLLLLLLVLLFLGVFFFLTKNHSLKIADCRQVQNKYSCYAQQAHLIAVSQGVPRSLTYAKQVIFPESGYGLTHLILHKIGEDAILQTMDVPQALRLVEPFTSTEITSDGFDGYLHGVFRGYFKMNAGVPVSELMQHVCSDYYSADYESIDTHSHHGSKADECFHGVGHALMYLYDNNISDSIASCKSLPYSWMKKPCFRGLFMEEMYRYSSFLSDDPNFSENDSMLTLCNQLSGEEAGVCVGFVGQSFLLKDENLEGAFAECNKLREENWKQSCSNGIALLWLPGIYRDDFSAIIKTCMMQGDFIGSCLNSANKGIGFGGAGEDRKNAPFCTLIEDIALQEECMRK